MSHKTSFIFAFLIVSLFVYSPLVAHDGPGEGTVQVGSGSWTGNSSSTGQ